MNDQQPIPNWQDNGDGTHSCLVGFQYDEVSELGEVRTFTVPGPTQLQGQTYRGCTRKAEEAHELEARRPQPGEQP